MKEFTREWLLDLESRIRAAGKDADAQSFDEILENMKNPPRLSPDEFAEMCAYVIMAGGYRQQNAQKYHRLVMDYIHEHGADYDRLITVFGHKPKIKTICDIWTRREELCAQYYELRTRDEKIAYMLKIPFIGPITVNHLARNLGEDLPKYDLWIQRLGRKFIGAPELKVDNSKLNPAVKDACDKMFAHLIAETGYPCGFIDVILWRACEQGMIDFPELKNGR